ncbi:MAG: NAD(P)H-binding protein [Phycisphaeraceae bacterium]|nr:NAD(P)H-binding protein [Phycisphaeraceae bacterium]MCB9847429.1 NAD(P)H-binding protein [Phycisphaeraceae bacterium]
MSDGDRHAVTGAFGYSGRYIAQRLLDDDRDVITLTNSPARDHDFGDRIPAHPLCFDDPEALACSLEGVGVLYNTYWVRFNHKSFNHADAVRNTMILFDAAKRAGVRRVVHVSITNPSEDSPLEYFSGKARLERALRESGLSHAILRPTVLFGKEDILINNIAWALRRLPVFGVFGDGAYRLQPIHVDDLAALAVEHGAGQESVTINAIGPETFTYRELVKAVGVAIGRRRPIFGVPPGLGYLVGSVLGRLVGDVLITREEIRGLMADLLCVETPPTGPTRLTEWMSTCSGTLGRQYTSELARRRDRDTAYRSN